MRQLWAVRASRLTSSPFVRSVSGMMIYTAIGHGIYVLAAPLIGRLYDPEQIGLYGLFFTIAATAAGFTCLLYDFAIPAATTDEDARRLTIGAAIIALIFCPAFGLGISLLSAYNLLGLGQLPPWAGLLTTLVLIAQTALQLAQAWLIRRQQTLLIGSSNVSLSLGRGLGQVLLGFAFPVWWVLALGELVGRVAGLGHLLRRMAIPNRVEVRAAQIWASLLRYREFPTVLVPAQALDAIVIVAQVSGLAVLFGPAALGQYYLMRRTLDIPTAFVFRSLSDVFYSKLAEYARSSPSSIRPFFTKAFLLLLAAGIIGGCPIIFFGPQLFQLIFGDGWATAGTLAAVMIPAAVLNLAVAPVSRVFALTTKPQLRFSLGIVSATGTGAVLLAAKPLDLDLIGVTAGFSAVITLSYIAYFAAGYFASGHIRDDFYQNGEEA